MQVTTSSLLMLPCFESIEVGHEVPEDCDVSLLREEGFIVESESGYSLTNAGHLRLKKLRAVRRESLASAPNEESLPPT
jgi:hypothetical protein